ncbi:hypothetical protein [Sphingomonas immobilis]|uniref:Uncharacterized protein n=1 Tax=Sphingomonas immobilis TaxID=3063997 RepID=A0ABT8ZW79_9SPHN|nr:hypothetical protein [Sphingomonas sp. CA1-15]MDO7841826.1 hypothetical protein [Sphingomonas sp. CA1-15]
MRSPTFGRRNVLIRIALLAVASLALSATPALAAKPCKDAKGKFVKCPEPAKATSTGISKGKDGKCRNAKGRFAKCP